MSKNLYVLRSAVTQLYYDGARFGELYASRAVLVEAANEFEAVRDGCHPWTGRIDAILMGPAGTPCVVSQVAPLLEAVNSLLALCPSDEGLGGHAPVGALLSAAANIRSVLTKHNL